MRASYANLIEFVARMDSQVERLATAKTKGLASSGQRSEQDAYNELTFRKPA
jgi:hypothetical protein